MYFLLHWSYTQVTIAMLRDYQYTFGRTARYMDPSDPLSQDKQRTHIQKAIDSLKLDDLIITYNQQANEHNIPHRILASQVSPAVSIRGEEHVVCHWEYHIPAQAVSQIAILSTQ
jgi:hypothetical protein